MRGGRAAALLLTALAVAAPAVAAAVPCEKVAGNLVANCSFTKDISGWKSQAVTTLAFDGRHGVPAPGALRMTNQPASEAGAATCVTIVGSGTYELTGWLRRLDGPGECLAFLEEHGDQGCTGGASGFHTLTTQPLVAGAFKQVSGSAAVAAATVAVRAGFACYGEHDDDVQSVVLDNVVLRKVEPPAAAGR